jgi:hypothetical protein
MNGSDEASAILLRALTNSTGRTRETLANELLATRDDRAAPLFCYLLKHMKRSAFPRIYAAAVEALGSSKVPGAVEALKVALQQGELWSPMRTRRMRAGAAASLRIIGTPSYQRCAPREPARAARARLPARSWSMWNKRGVDPWILLRAAFGCWLLAGILIQRFKD